ncbi:MAG: hypothetical protein ACC726_03570 [Chloroflexota bacterium]
MAFARSAIVSVALLVAVASSIPVVSLAAADSDVTDEIAATGATGATGEVITIANEGGALEGHTPTAFAGMSTGLFAGDNLNPSFPEGVGVQTYLTFFLPPELDVSSAQIVSDALRVSGTPFEDLGPLLAEPVVYESFGPELFDLAAIGPPTECTVTSETSIQCDATDALVAADAEGMAAAQFRIRFEVPADNDGSQDLAMFFRTDSNTNEAGLFELVISQNP